MNEPFFSGDQILNQVFDRENGKLRVEGISQSSGGGGEPLRPLAAWKDGAEFGIALVENAYTISRMEVDCT